MSWQRIDENTYIDDTLVTCAEYQLFIDDMREQGKYYQPDHWTSYQFPKGQAHEPILGVRHSDAVAFCDWLTQKDIKEWKFRLPIREEVTVFPFKPLRRHPSGYWIASENKLIWAGRTPNNVRILNLEQNRKLPMDLAYILDKVREEVIAHIRISYLEAIQSNNQNLETFLANTFENEAKLEMLQVYTEYKKTKEFINPLVHKIDRTRERAKLKDKVINTSLNRFRGRIYDSDHDRARERKFDRARSNAIKHSRVNVKKFDDFNIDNARSTYMDIDLKLTRIVSSDPIIAKEPFSNEYLDLLTLQERIAGRSPAFEGIRLVKERIR